MDTAATQLAVQAWRPVGAARIDVDAFDLDEQLGVSDRPW